MSNDKTEVIPTVAPVPTRRSILRAARAAQPERSPFADWRGRAQTELLPVVGRPAPSRRESTASTASTAAGTAFPRVSTHLNPTAGRVARRTAPTRTKGLRRQSRLRRHLCAALAGIAIAAALLTGLQLYAAAGISSARQAALASSSSSSSSSTGQAATLPRTEGGDQPSMSGQTATMSDRAPAAQPDVRSDIQAEWVTARTGAAYGRTDPAASPLDLPRCTTSPDTPLPCLATISPSQTRAVVLLEDASLTALVRR